MQPSRMLQGSYVSSNLNQPCMPCQEFQKKNCPPCLPCAGNQIIETIPAESRPPASRIQYVTIQRSIIQNVNEQIQVDSGQPRQVRKTVYEQVEQLIEKPVQRTVQDYYAVQVITEYKPQYKPSTKTQKKKVEKIIQYPVYHPIDTRIKYPDYILQNPQLLRKVQTQLQKKGIQVQNVLVQRLDNPNLRSRIINQTYDLQQHYRKSSQQYSQKGQYQQGRSLRQPNPPIQQGADVQRTNQYRSSQINYYQKEVPSVPMPIENQPEVRGGYEQEMRGGYQYGQTQNEMRKEIKTGSPNEAYNYSYSGWDYSKGQRQQNPQIPIHQTGTRMQIDEMFAGYD